MMKSLRVKILMNSKKKYSNVQEQWWKSTLKRICTMMTTFHTIQQVIKTERDRNWILKCFWVRQDNRRRSANFYQISNLSLMEITWTQGCNQEDLSILHHKLQSRSQVKWWKISQVKLTKRKETGKTQTKCNTWCRNIKKTQPGAKKLANE